MAFSFSEALEYLERTKSLGSRPGLATVSELARRMGDPQLKVPCAHIAGTNGKGGTAACLASILREAGFCVGLFTSPPLLRDTEYIRVNGDEIAPEDFAAVVYAASVAADGMEPYPTYYELVFAAAAYHFSKNCDFVVYEAYMGGLLDATNIVQPEVCVITSIALDHTQFLGDTVDMIAEQKGGIIKEGADVVIATEEGRTPLLRICAQKGITPSFPRSPHILSRKLTGQRFEYEGLEYYCKCPAGFFMQNAASALAAADALSRRGFAIDTEAYKRGTALAEWPGRFELMSSEPTVIVDGAHNPNGICSALKTITELLPNTKLRYVLAVMTDKAYDDMLALLAPTAAAFYISAPKLPRALPATTLAAAAGKYAATMKFDSVGAAIDSAIIDTRDGEAVCVIGTLYQVGAARAHLLSEDIK